MKDYKDLIGMISKIEEQDKKKSVNYVTMQILDSVAITMENPRNFAAMMAEVSRNDTFVAQKAVAQKTKKDRQQAMHPSAILPPEKFAPQAQEPVVAAQPPLFSMPKISAPKMPKFNLPSGFKMPTGQKQQAPAQNTQNLQQSPAAPQEPLASSATSELNNIIAEKKIAPPTAIAPIKMKPSSSKAVLPTLSITDQISELEKITESIKNNNFDSYQMEIVREELFALSDLLSSQQSAPPAQGADQALENLRKSRLTEALSLIPQA